MEEHSCRSRRLTVGRSAASRASEASGPRESEGGESAATPCWASALLDRYSLSTSLSTAAPHREQVPLSTRSPATICPPLTTMRDVRLQDAHHTTPRMLSRSVTGSDSQRFCA
jgi:hypothetical protein